MPDKQRWWNCQKRPNFLSQWEQSKDLTPYFLCFYVFKFQKTMSKKDEFLITMRAIKSFDTILFVSSCLQMKSNQKFWHHNFCVLKFHKIVSKKGRIAYHNESNKKFWHHIFCVFMSSNLRKLCQKRMNFLSQWEQ